MSSEVSKHRSPNYPAHSLAWAVETALSLLAREGKHPIPVNILAQRLGYKDETNGSARRAIANLRAFGLMDKIGEGRLAISPDVGRYKLMPNQDGKSALLKKWFSSPTLYAALIDKYDGDLPSDEILIYELVDQHGFSEQAAKNAIKVFRESRDFAFSLDVPINESEESDSFEDNDLDDRYAPSLHSPSTSNVLETATHASFQQTHLPPNANIIRYPVRLSGGRMVWLDIPSPFYERDKAKILAQISVIGTDDEDNKFEDVNM